MKSFLQKALDHMRYPTSWLSLIALATTAGINIRPELGQAIATFGGGLATFVLFFFTDSDVKPK